MSEAYSPIHSPFVQVIQLNIEKTLPKHLHLVNDSQSLSHSETNYENLRFVYVQNIIRKHHPAFHPIVESFPSNHHPGGRLSSQMYMCRFGVLETGYKEYSAALTMGLWDKTA